MPDAEQALPFWKWSAAVAWLVAAGSLVGLAAVLLVPAWQARSADERLIGTWQSDADRTIAYLRERRPVDDKQEAALRKLFGKLRVTYTATTLTSDLDGMIETSPYQTLGKDAHSVVIRESGRKRTAIEDSLELSEFQVIQFDGPDSYWVTTQVGGTREYFKRVR